MRYFYEDNKDTLHSNYIHHFPYDSNLRFPHNIYKKTLSSILASNGPFWLIRNIEVLNTELDKAQRSIANVPITEHQTVILRFIFTLERKTFKCRCRQKREARTTIYIYQQWFPKEES